MIDDDVYDDEPSEEEEEEDDEFGGPGDDDFGADEGYLEGDDDEEEAGEPAAAPRPRRRVSTRQATIGGVPRSKLEKPEHAAKAWAELSTKIGGDDVPAPYSIRGSYAKDTRVDHPKFGIGFVIEVSGPTKVDVLFEDGLRKLVQNR